jgi:hypothetical protein
MKKICLIIFSLSLTTCIFAQPEKEVNLILRNNEIQSRFANRKEKGFYNIMQVSFLFGNVQIIDRIPFNLPGYSSSSPLYPNTVYYQSVARNTLAVAPSFTISGGHMFNQHWAAGAGVGFEVFDHNLFPLFAELRYTLWDQKISPFFALKGGYAFGGFKAIHYDELYLNWTPNYLNDAELRHYGGLMFHPEIGVKVPLNENCDLMFTAAYRVQKTKSVARKEYENGQFDEWEHTEELNRLSLGVAIMFR